VAGTERLGRPTKQSVPLATNRGPYVTAPTTNQRKSEILFPEKQGSFLH
jgi:hypothetical protein